MANALFQGLACLDILIGIGGVIVFFVGISGTGGPSVFKFTDKHGNTRYQIEQSPNLPVQSPEGYENSAKGQRKGCLTALSGVLLVVFAIWLYSKLYGSF